MTEIRWVDRTIWKQEDGREGAASIVVRVLQYRKLVSEPVETARLGVSPWTEWVDVPVVPE